MTLTVRFDPAAQNELDAAHDWYERKSPGIGGDFVAEVQRAAQDAAAWPAIARQVVVPGTSRETRRASLRRFSYGIIYAHSPPVG